MVTSRTRALYSTITDMNTTGRCESYDLLLLLLLSILAELKTVRDIELYIYADMDIKSRRIVLICTVLKCGLYYYQIYI